MGTKLAKNESTDSHMTLSPQYLRERWKSRAMRTAVILGAPSSAEAVSLKLRLSVLVESVTAPCFQPLQFGSSKRLFKQCSRSPFA